jgi:hypothetical protein
VTNPRADERLKILVYSDDADTRSQVMLGLGRRPHPDLPEVEYVEVATEPVVLQQMDSGRIDLVAGRRSGVPPDRPASAGRDRAAAAAGGAGAGRDACRRPLSPT